ncbi:unnamed protein product [Rhizophagus irregularis]|nr:unnamed protein product [Rhizophagus irregularis]
MELLKHGELRVVRCVICRNDKVEEFNKLNEIFSEKVKDISDKAEGSKGMGTVPSVRFRFYRTVEPVPSGSEQNCSEKSVQAVRFYGTVRFQAEPFKKLVPSGTALRNGPRS